MSDGGKGSAPRPFSVSQEQFAANWEAIFGKKTVAEPNQSKQDDQKENNNESTNSTNHPTSGH